MFYKQYSDHLQIMEAVDKESMKSCILSDWISIFHFCLTTASSLVCKFVTINNNSKSSIIMYIFSVESLYRFIW